MTKPEVGTRYTSLAVAKMAILEWIVDNGQSFKVSKAASTVWVALCRDNGCSFRVRIMANEDGARITKFTEHNCPHSTHQGFRQANSVSLLAKRHRSTVVDNRNITPKQLKSNEKVQNANQIPYLQAWRTREVLRQEIEGDEQASF